MMTDSELLKKAISDSGIMLGKIAECLGMSRFTLRSRINGKSEFTASEIDKLTKLLNLSRDKRDAIFFAA